jgi:hypothetical protein
LEHLSTLIFANKTRGQPEVRNDFEFFTNR